MKKLTLIQLLFASLLWANPPNEISFYGVVDASDKFRVGEPITITAVFNPNTGLILRFDIAIGMDFDLRAPKPAGNVAFDNDPAHGSVFYQIINSEFMEVTAQAATPNGVIPCIDNFNEADFVLSQNPFWANTSGHLTSSPVIR